MDELATGLYEQIVTQQLATALEAAHLDGQTSADRHALHHDESPDLVTAHVAALLRRALRSRKIRDDVTAQVSLANRLAEAIRDTVPDAADADDVISASQELLRAVTRSRSPDGNPQFPARPETPLSNSALLINAHGQPSIGHELKRELESADRVDLLCAFIRWYGIRIIEDELEAFISRGGRMRVITTTYLGSTQLQALDRLAELGAQIKVSYETRTTRLHAKAWYFARETGFSTAYVGSSNLSKAALIDGLEWNVRLSAVEQPHLLRTFEGTFDDYWADPSFEPYDPARSDDRERLAQALLVESSGPRDLPLKLSAIEVRPYGYQAEVLAELDAERRVHGRWKNLVVMATGTGKTVVAGLDYRRLREKEELDSLLFIAHRGEILEQARLTFRQILGDGDFGQYFVGGNNPDEWRHVFASIQSMHRMDFGHLDPSLFDVVIVDEFHHSEAPTYTKLLRHLQPKVLLGLTATPERTDGQDIKHWFNDRIATELRLWEAIDRQLLAPFQYFGVHDNVDVSAVEWRRGRGYDLKALSNVYTADDARVNLIVRTLRRKVGDVARMRALGFCVSRDHADYMAAKFRDVGIPAVAITSRTSREDRDAGMQALKDRKVNAVFSVDLFNEGVDVPSIDTVLFLRPTDSATVFLQQLGRGLRLADDKPCLTVLDFIGNQHREFRFDRKYRALTGLPSRMAVERGVNNGFPHLPVGCNIDLDREVSRLVLANIRETLNYRWPDLARELKSMPPETTLADFLDEAGLELEDLYRRSRLGWADLKRLAGRASAPGRHDKTIGRAIGRSLHIDDPERLSAMSHLHTAIAATSVRGRRLAGMLDAQIWGGTGDASEQRMRLSTLLDHRERAEEIRELAGVLGERRHRVTEPVGGDLPLHIHAAYSKNEALAAFGEPKPGHIREGVRNVKDENADVFFVTIEKTEAHYSPTTMYQDRAITPVLFQWESQSTLRRRAQTAQRYMNGSSTVHLFIRQSKRDEGFGAPPFLYAGPMTYVDCQGDRPVRFTWQLQHALPPDVFNYAHVTAT